MVLCVAVLGIACSKSSPAGSGSSPKAPKDLNCSAVRPPAEPELMAWEPSSRAELDKLRRRGVVAVRYEAHGCEVSLELLPNCIGPKNRYVYSPFKKTSTKIAHDLNELFVQLPLGAPNVSSLMNDNQALRTDSRLVGTVGLPAGTTVTATDLVGPECKRATHVVSVLYVGGFAMAAAKPSQVNAKNLFDVATPPRDGMTREGLVQACQNADTQGVELSGCAVPLRVALLPLYDALPTAQREAGQARPKTDEPAPAELGLFDDSAIERIVRDRHGIVKRKCWDGAPNTVRRVDVTITTTVSKEGRAARVEPQIVDSEGAPDDVGAVARCVAGEVQAWAFPLPEKERTVKLPFHLIRQ
jgi:hypothetical protein